MLLRQRRPSRHILDALTHVSGSDGYTLWTYPEGAFLTPDMVAHAMAAQRPEIVVVKSARRRLVARVRAGEGRTVIFKAFPLDPIARLRYRKYALRELENYTAARKRDVPTPGPLGYFEQRRLGLVSVTGLVLEDLLGWSSFRTLAEGGEGEVVRPVVVSLFAKLFETGVNHIDVNPDNMLFSPTKSEVRLIDWQYASFLPPRRVEQLVLQASRFLSYAGIAPPSPSGEAWLDALYAACRPDVALERFHEMIVNAAAVKQPYKWRLASRIRKGR